MITIKNLNFYYRKKTPILNDISTNFESGKIYGLLGTNGEGKTTLLKLIAGLIFPKTGLITIEKYHLSTDRSKCQLSQLYMLTDQPENSSLKIEEFVNIYSVFYKKYSKELFEETLALFKIQAKSKISSLSLGQQKKFQLAFALATNTKILLLDEPTNGLDIPSKAIFRKLLAKSINDEKTIIISTHLVNDVENLIDHLIIIKDSKLILDKDINQIQKEYRFGYSQQLTGNELYSEKSIASYKTISDNTENVESPVDIELLFNAIQNEKI